MFERDVIIAVFSQDEVNQLHANYRSNAGPFIVVAVFSPICFQIVIAAGFN
jgi:hypothetical protein